MKIEPQISGILTDQLLGEIIEIRRRFHQNPELSFKEFKTSETIRELLDRWEIEYLFPFVNTGILARIKGELPGKRIALRSDMDALPISEETKLDFASKNRGVMHACGHDIHMASLLGTIRVLNELKHEIHGEVLFIFQPGEEKNPGGAKLMLEEGVFDGREPDMIIAQHVLPEMETGHVGFRPGMYMASADEVYIVVKGKGGHGALQEGIRDPILMASRILLTLQEEIRRKAGSIPTVLSFGKVIADGAMNIVPDKVFLDGTFRTMNESWRKEAHEFIRHRSAEISAEMGGSVEVEIKHGYPVLHNDEALSHKSKMLAEALLGPDKVEEMDIRMTAEDFAWYTQSIPGMMYRLGVRKPGSEIILPLHTSRFQSDESSIKTGVSVMSYLAIELLKQGVLKK